MGSFYIGIVLRVSGRQTHYGRFFHKHLEWKTRIIFFLQIFVLTILILYFEMRLTYACYNYLKTSVYHLKIQKRNNTHVGIYCINTLRIKSNALLVQIFLFFSFTSCQPLGGVILKRKILIAFTGVVICTLHPFCLINDVSFFVYTVIYQSST